MGEHVAAAAPVGAASRRSGDAVSTSIVSAIEHALARALDSRAHALARDRAPHEHDLAVVPRQHPAAGGGLLYVEREDRVGHEGHEDELPQPQER